MENASKALLIAAAILIVIVLIAFGVSVLNSSGDVQSSATSTGSKLEDSANQAASKTNDILTGLQFIN